ATFRVGPSSSRPPSPARRRSVSRRPIGTSASPPQNLMRLQQNPDGAWTLPRSRSARRPKSWQPSPPTRTRSPPDTSRPPSPVEACCVSPAQLQLSGDLLVARRRGDRITIFSAAVHESAFGRFCCKSRKLQGYEFSRKHETRSSRRFV